MQESVKSAEPESVESWFKGQCFAIYYRQFR